MNLKCIVHRNLPPGLARMLMGISIFCLGSIPLHAQYCTPTSAWGCGDGDQVNTFILNGENGTSINDPNSGCASGDYSDQTATTSVDLQAGATYQAHVSTDYVSLWGGDVAAIWIDFDDDQVFQSSERVGTYGDLLNSVFVQDNLNGGTDVTLNIPITAPAGNHRMRVIVAYYLEPEDIDPCNAGMNIWDYGEAHDYTVNVLASTVTCLPPTNINASGVDAHNATISWTASTSAPANGYEYYFSTSATAPTATTSPSGSVASGTTALISSLSASTQYFVWVRAACSSTDIGPWSSSMVTFTTLCDESSIPYTMPLASMPNTSMGTDIPNCTSTELVNTNGTPWAVYNGVAAYLDYYGFSGNTLVSFYNFIGSGDVDSWIFTNGLNMTAGTLYSLHYRYGNDGPPYSEKMGVAIGAANNANAMTTLLADHTQISDGVPHDTTLYFTVPANGVYYIGFHAHSAEDQDILMLDSIHVDVAPICNAPTGLAETNITDAAATLSWSGNAGKYAIEYGPSGFNPGTGSIVYANAVPFVLNNLDPNTNYDYYVRSICVPNLDSSANSPVGSFQTLCNAVNVHLGNDTALCEGTSITYNAGNPGSTYQWNDNSSGQSFTTMSGGTIYVTVTNTFGCVGSDTVTVTEYPNPVVDLGPDEVVCNGATVLLDAGNPGKQYLWSTSQTTQTIVVGNAGVYYVTVTDNHLCNGSDTMKLVANDNPIVYGITGVKIEDGSYDFSPVQAEHVNDYFWDFGDGATATIESPNHRFTHTGNYLITLIVTNECSEDTVTTLLHHEDETGIYEFSGQDQLALYPNPAQTSVTLKNTSNVKMQSITVYNVLGQVVYQQKAENGFLEKIDLSGFSSGIYHLRVRIDGQFVMKKFEVLRQ